MSDARCVAGLACAAVFAAAGGVFFAGSYSGGYLVMSAGFLLLGLSRGSWFAGIVSLIPTAGCVFMWDLDVSFPYSRLERAAPRLAQAMVFLWPVLGFIWVTLLVGRDLIRGGVRARAISALAWLALLVGPWYVASFKSALDEWGVPIAPERLVVATSLLVAAAAVASRSLPGRTPTRPRPDSPAA